MLTILVFLLVTGHELEAPGPGPIDAQEPGRPGT